ncbi:MAG TPA: hypothetical protein VGL24_12630 [Chthoniobacterales bacterium]
MKKHTTAIHEPTFSWSAPLMPWPLVQPPAKRAPKAIKEAVADKNSVLIDTRTMLGFGGGHIRGALNTGGSP